MWQTGVSTAGCHLHVDVRPGGVVSQVVRVAAQLLTAEGETPLSDTRVEFAGMPARTDAEGRFELTHVLTPGAYPLEALAPDGRFWSRILTVHGGRNVVRLALAGAPAIAARPRLRLRITRRQGDAVLVLVANEGRAVARDINWSAVAVAGGPGVISVAPRRLSGLAPGETAPILVRLSTATGPPEFRLLATYGDLAGRGRTVALRAGGTPGAMQLASRGEREAPTAESDAEPPTAPAESPPPEPMSLLPGLPQPPRPAEAQPPVPTPSK